MKRPAWMGDPLAPSVFVLLGIVAAGFVAIGLGWRVAARNLDVSLQVPALVSGGLGGLVLVAIGAVFISTQVGRRLAARERAEVERVLDEAHGLLREARDRKAK